MRYSLILFGGKNEVINCIEKNEYRPKFIISELEHRKGTTIILGIGGFKKFQDIENVLSDAIKKSFPQCKNTVHTRGYVKTENSSMLFVQEQHSNIEIIDTISKFDFVLKKQMSVEKIEVSIPKWVSSNS